ncbi:hypothetical protein DKE52_008155 [Acinetobacter pittii]|uniref:Uncharacterized protein n=1 Tax=Acinetobacter pittii TaxID=48296 RepID=A0A3G6YJE5_ACIPI|nr:hypothetical protein DKE52_008155 [Acinetobacter pittii]
MLIKAAQSKNLIPLYCLYIQKNDLLNDLNPLLAWVKCFHYIYTLEHFGCSILSVENVKRLKKAYKKDHLGDVIDKIYPWHFFSLSSSLSKFKFLSSKKSVGGFKRVWIG